MKKLLVATFTSVLLAASAVTFAQELPPVPTVPDNAYAAFIDTYQFAVAKGATAEWRKLEWLAVDTKNSLLYVTSSNLAKGMTDGEGDMQFEETACGAIFSGSYDADMNLSRLELVLPGGALDEANEENACDTEAIAGPDNLFVDPMGGLWIGEDTDGHLNNVLWMWNGTDLKRFATVPLGSEVTGLHIAADGTLFMNVQHPEDTNQEPYTAGIIGVVKGFKAGEDFEGLSVPATDEEKTTVRVAAGEYQVLARSGDTIPGTDMIFGTNIAHDGTVLDVCNDPDGNMFLPMSDTEAILYTNFECAVGGASQLNLTIDAEGVFTVASGTMLDFIPVNGTTSNCGASVTPWNTGLSAEEYPADNEEDWQYWLGEQGPGLEALLGKKPNPFDQGYSVELIPAAEGTKIEKRYAMGRFSQEVAIVMPDQKTVYFGDDGTDRIFFKFIADTAGDLSAGTLYAAKTAMDGETAMTIEWIMLGQGADAEIAAAIRALDAEFAQ